MHRKANETNKNIASKLFTLEKMSELVTASILKVTSGSYGKNEIDETIRNTAIRNVFQGLLKKQIELAGCGDINDFKQDESVQDAFNKLHESVKSAGQQTSLTGYKLASLRTQFDNIFNGFFIMPDNVASKKMKFK